MKYSKLAEVYEDLEQNAAKLKKTEIIAKLLKKTSVKQLPEVVLLVSGRVFPQWSEEVTGVATKLMIRALSKATGIDQKDIIEDYAVGGDLGLTAERFIKKKKQATLFSKELTVDKVFKNLQKIGRQEGAGSQDKKLALTAELLSSSKSKEAKYIVRTLLEQLRIGVADGIIRDAIAQAFKVDKKILEQAWSRNPDYADLAVVARDKGEKGLQKVKMEFGTPIIVALAEKSPGLKEAIESFDKVGLEYKYDGARTLIQKKGTKVWVFTRRLENVSNAFPDIVDLVKKHVKAKECIIDGETLAIDKKTKRPLPFQMLSMRIKRKHNIRETVKQIPAQLNIFDILYYNGKNLTDLPLSERRKILEKQIDQVKGKIVLSKQLITKDLKKAEKFYKESLRAGQEGLIVKNLDAQYRPGRRVAVGWLKVKPVMESLDLAIVGATWGAGKRAGWLGSLLLACRKGDKFLKIGMLGTGIKEKKTKPEDVTFKELTELLKPHIISQEGNKVKIKPKIVIEVAYEEIQKSPTYKSGLALRFPRSLGIRWEKSPSQADTMKRVKRLYDQQRGRHKKKSR